MGFTIGHGPVQRAIDALSSERAPFRSIIHGARRAAAAVKRKLGRK